MLEFELSIRMGNKGDLCDFEHGGCISETAVLLVFTHTTTSTVYRERSEREKTSGEEQLSKQKILC